MKSRKAADASKIVAEMLKAAVAGLPQTLAGLLSEVLLGREVPQYWLETRLQVLLKKGDPQALQNYRPI